MTRNKLVNCERGKARPIEGRFYYVPRGLDYALCLDCETIIDVLAYDSIEDAGHQGHQLRRLNELERREALEECRKVGCLGDRAWRVFPATRRTLCHEAGGVQSIILQFVAPIHEDRTQQ